MKKARTDPAKAIELYAKLSEFVLPKIKQVNAEISEPKEKRISQVNIHHVYHSPNNQSLKKSKPMGSA